MKNIKLAEQTISKTELRLLAKWIKEDNQLTKGPLTKEFENEFSRYIGVNHSVFVNSGSSANLLMIYSLLEGKYLKNNNIIVPAISWITTLSPIIQLGLNPILCEADKNDLGIDLEYFEYLCKKHNPSLLIIVHVLGHPNKIEEILKICNKYNVILIEDACEALGTAYKGFNAGNLGRAGSFSFYYGHHISTIEGGMVTTNDTNLYNIMLSIRSHGWSRDVDFDVRNKWSSKFDIDEIRSFYTFYYPGFNLRSTDLNAFLGLSQIKKLNSIIEKRERNFNYYKKLLHPRFYCQSSENDKLSSFAYGTFVKNRMEVYEALKNNNIESRPLICGSMGRQPFWVKKFGLQHFKIADLVHENGIYLPNHSSLTINEIKYISKVFINSAIPLFP